MKSTLEEIYCSNTHFYSFSKKNAKNFRYLKTTFLPSACVLINLPPASLYRETADD